MADRVKVFGVNFTFKPQDRDQYNLMLDWLTEGKYHFVAEPTQIQAFRVNPVELAEKIGDWGWTQQFHGM